MNHEMSSFGRYTLSYSLYLISKPFTDNIIKNCKIIELKGINFQPHWIFEILKASIIYLAIAKSIKIYISHILKYRAQSMWMSNITEINQMHK